MDMTINSAWRFQFWCHDEKQLGRRYTQTWKFLKLVKNSESMSRDMFVIVIHASLFLFAPFPNSPISTMEWTPSTNNYRGATQSPVLWAHVRLKNYVTQQIICLIYVFFVFLLLQLVGILESWFQLKEFIFHKQCALWGGYTRVLGKRKLVWSWLHF